MKVSINFKFMDGPYGGGAQFASGLRDYLASEGVTVVNHLNDSDIDVILNVNPFPFISGKISMYSFLDAYAYQLKYPGVKIVQRVNECDERKGTNYMNKLLVLASQYSDFTVFVGSWLVPLLQKAGFNIIRPHRTIHSGGDTQIFNTTGKQWWDGTGPLKIVTHHWSPSYFKGHDAYQELDRLLDDPTMRECFEFTYVGARPKDLKYKNTNFIEPLSGTALGGELRKHHIYITASKNDPGPMHSIEAVLSGLPILYINSGGLSEMCKGYGLEFNLENLPQKIEEMRTQYNSFKAAIPSYPNTSDRMGKDYLNLFKELPANRRPRAKASIFYRAYFWLFRKIFNLYWKIKLQFRHRTS